MVPLFPSVDCGKGHAEFVGEFGLGKEHLQTKCLDSFGIGQVNINFEKKPIEGDFATFVNESYTPMKYDSNYDLVSSGPSSIAGYNGFEYIYTSKDNGVQKQHKAVWFEKGGQAYVLLYSAPLDKFEKNLYVFDYILSDMQVT